MTSDRVRYPIVLADPPWAYRAGDDDHGKAEGQYGTMTISDLCALPVGGLATEDAVLLMWATWPQLPDAMRLLAAWGFEFVSGFPWIKIVGAPRHNLEGELQIKPVYGIGYWVRGCSEFVLIGRRGNPPVPRSPFVGLLSKNFGHSRKPENLYEYAESLPGEGPYLELFARRPRDGWRSVGNEISGLDIRDELAAMVAGRAECRCWTCRGVFVCERDEQTGEMVCHSCRGEKHRRHHAAWLRRIMAEYQEGEDDGENF